MWRVCAVVDTAVLSVRHLMDSWTVLGPEGLTGRGQQFLCVRPFVSHRIAGSRGGLLIRDARPFSRGVTPSLCPPAQWPCSRLSSFSSLFVVDAGKLSYSSKAVQLPAPCVLSCGSSSGAGCLIGLLLFVKRSE